ncbi:MAG: SDR family NAD(P)-dependent oxidoreductase [Jhaorihella sp.]
MDLGLEGRVAVITGAARGIGAGIAQAFVREGMKVVIGDVSPSVTSTAERLSGNGGETFGVIADVTQQKDCDAMAAAAVDRFGRLDVLVNNAGFPKDSYISKMSEGDWDSVVDVIMKGAFLCTRACIPHMIGARFGRIISISSRAHLGNPGQANYSAAKAGLIGFTRAMALESGKFNVTANVIAPGFIKTEGIAALPHYDQIAERAIAATPLPRVGDVDDIASAATFLASERAGYITGETLHVTGGRYA